MARGHVNLLTGRTHDCSDQTAARVKKALPARSRPHTTRSGPRLDDQERGELNVRFPQLPYEKFSMPGLCRLVSFPASDSVESRRLRMIVGPDGVGMRLPLQLELRGCRGPCYSRPSISRACLSVRCVHLLLRQTTLKGAQVYFRWSTGMEVHCCVGPSRHRLKRQRQA
jgi:hypothetical protein